MTSIKKTPDSVTSVKSEKIKEVHRLVNHLKSASASYGNMSQEARQRFAEDYSRFSDLARELNIDNPDKMLPPEVQQTCQIAVETSRSGSSFSTTNTSNLSYNDIQQYQYQQQQQIIYQQQIDTIVTQGGIDGAIEAYKKGLIKSLNHIPVDKIHEAKDIKNLVKNGYDVDAPDLNGKILSEEINKRIQSATNHYKQEVKKLTEIDSSAKERIKNHLKDFVSVYNSASPEEREQLIKQAIQKHPKLKGFFAKNMGAVIGEDGSVHLPEDVKNKFIKGVDINRLNDKQMATLTLSDQPTDTTISYTDANGNKHTSDLPQNEQERRAAKNRVAGGANAVAAAQTTQDEGSRAVEDQTQNVKGAANEVEEQTKAGQVVIAAGSQNSDAIGQSTNGANEALEQGKAAIENVTGEKSQSGNKVSKDAAKEVKAQTNTGHAVIDVESKNAGAIQQSINDTDKIRVQGNTAIENVTGNKVSKEATSTKKQQTSTLTKTLEKAGQKITNDDDQNKADENLVANGQNITEEQQEVASKTQEKTH